MIDRDRYTVTMQVGIGMPEDELRQELAACKQKIGELERQLANNTAGIRQTNQDLQQFAYVASHDFREPLRAIVSYTQLLEMRYGKQLDAAAHEFMKQVITSAHRMSDLVDGLVSYSRVSSTEVAGRGRVSVNGVLAGVMLKMDRTIREAGATIQCGDLPELMAEEQSLERLFQELIANSLVYRSAQPPDIRIHAREDGEFWEFAVADNGIGIDPAYHERIFGLFKRLHGPNIPGVGLGLTISRKIVEQHGGRMWVESKLGQGTTFRFTLPA
jgi:light-regulated signal transduction histidine kinase (bacteriophytochrome)